MVRIIRGIPALPAGIMAYLLLGATATTVSAQELSPAQKHEDMVRGKVIRVLDGKTLLVMLAGKKTKIHLHGVDTPAEVNPSRESFYHKKAVRFLKRFVKGQQIMVDMLDLLPDRRGSHPAYIYRLSDHLFVNYAIIRLGFAHAHTQTPYKFKRLFQYGEREAREEGVGLWGILPPEKREISSQLQPSGKLTAEATVYLTIADKKYHRDYCRKLRHSRYPVSLKQAEEAGYTPCELCFPQTKE